jgi:hypothetical protein
MAGKKTSGRAVAPVESQAEPTKAQLQRRMEEAREDISQTVEEIKDTVTEQYESVKETVVQTLDWREQFRKHTIAWSLGALAVGYIVGSGLAAALEDSTRKKGRKSSGLLDEIYALGERLSDEFSGITQTILLPALSKKIKNKFGIDLSERLQAAIKPAKRATGTRQRAAKKGGAKKAAKKSAAKKRASGKRAARKTG